MLPAFAGRLRRHTSTAMRSANDVRRLIVSRSGVRGLAGAGNRRSGRSYSGSYAVTYGAPVLTWAFSRWASAQIETLPSGSLRVRVYAGIDPVSKKRHYLVETVPAGPKAAAEARRSGPGC